MKYLIVYAHPNPKSFCRAIQETLDQALTSSGHEVRVRDLYARKFDPVLTAEDFEAGAKGAGRPDVVEEQGHVAWADVIVFIHPNWWANVPAILRGWVDRVFSQGFAYSFGPGGLKKLLSSKKTYRVTTMGETVEDYARSGMQKGMDLVLSTSVADFCGIQDLGSTYFGAVPRSTPQEREAMLRQVQALALTLS